MESIILFASGLLNVVLLCVVSRQYWSRYLLACRRLVAGPTHQFVSTPVVYHALGEKVFYLTDCTPVSGVQLPDQLVISPACYQFGDGVYDLSEEGLYRLMLPSRLENRQCIVYQHNVSSLLSALSWMIAHGHRDDHLPIKNLISKAKREKLILTCEASVRFAQAILNDLRIRSRIIATRALTHWTGYDDGHYLIEVYHAELKKWILYDLDNHAVFTSHTTPLSMLEFIEKNETGDYHLSFLSGSALINANDVNETTQYSYVFIDEGRVVNLKNWYKRIMAFFFVEEAGYYAFKDQQPDLSAYPRGAFPSIHYLDRAVFIDKFYHTEVDTA